MKPKNWASSVTEFAGGEDEKVNQIVDEVDRFFKSVHADIEDWKFSMEDYGDGPRIFVRFQIHINKSGVAPQPGLLAKKPAGPAEAGDPVKRRARKAGTAHPERRKVADEESRGPDAPGAAERGDLDLASFVKLWRRKRASSLASEYHKEGAPYADGLGEWKGEKRSSEDATPSLAGERTDEGSKGSDAGP